MPSRQLIRYATPLLLLTAFGCGSASVPGTAAPIAEAEPGTGADVIHPQDLYDRIDFLSTDEMAGRDTPSDGLETAAAYLVSEHRALGLEPAGENSTYYQRYPFRVRRVDLRTSPTGATVQEESFPPNVLAVLPGSDPELRDEYVVLSAHFDHVGIGTPVNGDSIYNGADDNGSGTAALLEIAQAFSSLAEKPRRSIVFLHVSGEEHGLVGSEYFSENPTIPLDRIVANINVDMIGRNSRESVVVIGKDYSSLGEVVERVARSRPELGMTAASDPWPQERFFFRSDHYNFARKGVPAVFFFSGVHEDYHRPADTVDKIDTEKAARITKLIYYTALEVANADQRPVWDPDGLREVRRLTQ